MKNETALRKWLRASLPSGVCTFTQPGLGGTVGQPDVLVIVQPSGLLAPIELKVAEPLSNGRLRPHRILPVQIAWHDAHSRAGGCSFVLLGVPGDEDGQWECWLLDHCRAEVLSGWRRGFSPADLTLVAAAGKLYYPVWWETLRGSSQARRDMACTSRCAIRYIRLDRRSFGCLLLGQGRQD